MTAADLAGYVQHTEVSATADRARIEQVLSECLTHGFDGAMVQPCWVPLAAETLAESDVSVCTALGYPLGGDRTRTKVARIHDAVAAAADEIDVMANLGWLRSGDDDAFRQELSALVDAAGDATIKLLLELGGLTDAEAEGFALTCMARPQSDLKLRRGVYPPSLEGEAGASGAAADD
jgi:deoxyribose-phosphate aldolase